MSTLTAARRIERDARRYRVAATAVVPAVVAVLAAADLSAAVRSG